MEKTYVFDNGGNDGCGMNGLIASLCQNRGLDPNMVAAMMNQNGMNGGGWWIWIVVLLLFGWGGFGGNGFGGRGNAQGIADAVQLLNGNDGRELLLQAINGNGAAIGQLSTKLGCDFGALNAAIQNLSTQLCTLGGQIGLGQKDIIMQMMNGNQSIISQVCNCCCDLRAQIADFKGDVALQMCQQTNSLTNSINNVAIGQERGFSSVAYETQRQTCDITNAIEAQSRMINDKFCALEMREQQREIQQLREQNQQLALAASQAAQTQAIVNQLQPVAKPAYLTCSPYQSAYGYPYGYNGGCGCNNNCNNNCGGCGCC